jgi:cobalt-zinc-cadmium efflux system membrane fusion protein
MKINTKILFAVILIIALSMTGCGEDVVRKEPIPVLQTRIEPVVTSVAITKAQFINAGIQLGRLRDGKLSETIKASGEVAVLPQDYAKVSTYIGGIVKTIRVQEGDYVKKGQTVFTLEHPDYIKLQQEYLVTKNNLNFLEKEYERQKELFENKAAVGKVFQEAESKYNAEKGNIEALRNQLAMLSIPLGALDEGQMLRAISLKSPISGYVGELNISIGAYAEPNIPLLDITNTNNLIVHIDIFEKDVVKVARGQRVEIVLPNQDVKSIQGEITSIGKNVNRKTNTISISAKINDKNDLLIPGMFVKTYISISEVSSTVVPQGAVIRSGSEKYVFMATDEWCASPEKVKSALQVNTPKAEMSQDSISLSYEMIEVKTSSVVDGYIGIVPEKDMSDYVIVVEAAYYLMSQLKSGETVGCCPPTEEKTEG